MPSRFRRDRVRSARSIARTVCRVSAKLRMANSPATRTAGKSGTGAIRQPGPDAQLGVQQRREAPAEQGIDEIERRALRVAPIQGPSHPARNRTAPNRVNPPATTRRRRSLTVGAICGSGRAAGRHAPKRCITAARSHVHIDVTCDHEHGPVGADVRAVEVEHIAAGHRLQANPRCRRAAGRRDACRTAARVHTAAAARTGPNPSASAAARSAAAAGGQFPPRARRGAMTASASSSSIRGWSCARNWPLRLRHSGPAFAAKLPPAPSTLSAKAAASPRAGALVEQPGSETGDAGAARWIAQGTAADQHLERDQRHVTSWHDHQGQTVGSTMRSWAGTPKPLTLSSMIRAGFSMAAACRPCAGAD